MYHFWWKSYEKHIVLNNINNRLNRIAVIAHYKENNNATLPEIISFAQELYNHCKTTEIPTRSYKNLETLINKLREINKHDFWIVPQRTKTDSEYLKYVYWLINLQQDKITYTFY
jgi:GTPase Era involved in 16S rRNA processing